MTMPLLRAGLIAAAVALLALPALSQSHSFGKDCRNKPGHGTRFNKQAYVYFDTGSATLDGRSADVLDQVYDRATGLDAQQICLFGKASKAGNAAANARLSLKRSEAVAKALVQRGWSRDRIAIEPEGEAFGWIAETLTDDTRADRRVRIRLSM